MALREGKRLFDPACTGQPPCAADPTARASFQPCVYRATAVLRELRIMHCLPALRSQGNYCSQRRRPVRVPSSPAFTGETRPTSQRFQGWTFQPCIHRANL